ncbi:MAG: hypothetical protein PHP46_06495, partial [Candidatus Omnitrophica bacterium]|nr:hypothetical protein [Candidatus Omnitrophota bacterium]
MNRRLYLALMLMGFTSLAAQTLLIREFFITFNGNELTIGIVLANWILLAALGSSIGNRFARKAVRPIFSYSLLQVGITLYLPISIFLIRTIKNIIHLPPAEGVGIFAIVSASFLIPSVLGILTGLQFPFGCRILRDVSARPLESAGIVYILESIGFIIAGAAITYLLIPRLDSFSIVLFAGLLNTLSASFLLKNERSPGAFTKFFQAVAAFLAVLIIISFFGPASRVQHYSLKEQWRGRNLLDYGNSVYGNLAVTKNADQYTFYSNGLPIIVTPLPDIAPTEDLVHFTMLSHPGPKEVLLIGGGAGGMIHEILKYPVERLTYIELDPTLIKLVKEYPTDLTNEELDDKRLETIYMDGRRFLKTTKRHYDIVIVNLPIPSTLQLNRFYTKEFFENVRSSLKDNGIFAFRLLGSLSYLSPELRDLNGSILNTLKDVFFPVVIPGYSNIYLASKRELNIVPELLLKRLEEKGIHTKIFNKLYLEDRLNPEWLKWFNRSLSGYTTLRKNSDLRPIGTYYAVSYWNSLFSPRFQTLVRTWAKIKFLPLLLALAICGALLSAITLFIPQPKKYSTGLAILSPGFTGMSLNLILIYAYQSFYGFVFYHIA